MVPPPPTSTLPSSPICQMTLLSLKMVRTLDMNSAEASEEPPLPPPPVYFMRAMPQLIFGMLWGEETSPKPGSWRAQTSAESMAECSRARRVSRSEYLSTVRLTSSATVFSMKVDSMPVWPTEPISSLSQMTAAAVRDGVPFRSKMALTAPNAQTRSSCP